MLQRRRFGFFLMLGMLGSASGARGQVPLVEALQKLALLPPDACMAEGREDATQHPEAPVFAAAVALLETALNEDTPKEKRLTPEDRARAVVAEAAHEALAAQAAWPEQSRFRGEVVVAGPALVVTMFVRTRARWFAFGSVAARWKLVGEDDGASDGSPRRLMRVYRLRAGRPGTARFLAARTFFGCAGSSGIGYEVREWAPAVRGAAVASVLSQEGAFGMDEAADGRGPSASEPFWPVGKLVTAGPVLELPYCLFTGIDTWDNPSLCVLDRYDLRFGTPRFLSRRYNRPELLPIAKAIEYGRSHDLPAARAYCISNILARRFVQGGVPGPDTNVEVVRRGRGKRVWFGDRASWIDVEPRAGRWVIAGMSPVAEAGPG